MFRRGRRKVDDFDAEIAAHLHIEIDRLQDEDGLSREDIVDHCRSRLAAYKVPELVRVLDALPRSSTGKPSLGRLQALEDERTRT